MLAYKLVGGQNLPRRWTVKSWRQTDRDSLSPEWPEITSTGGLVASAAGREMADQISLGKLLCRAVSTIKLRCGTRVLGEGNTAGPTCRQHKSVSGEPGCVLLKLEN
ncbi:hypothetical protein RRG08_058848 [Elysia crispata]|uniref:Uncharacterized protein n=1 Tax=Elysia crispata TaxID=231223 RepID=A0AAE0XZY7_9GAST|nr:hypothetical protein RRG08_058848 [Elysia crispata]